MREWNGRIKRLDTTELSLRESSAPSQVPSAEAYGGHYQPDIANLHRLRGNVKRSGKAYGQPNSSATQAANVAAGRTASGRSTYEPTISRPFPVTFASYSTVFPATASPGTFPPQILIPKNPDRVALFLHNPGFNNISANIIADLYISFGAPVLLSYGGAVNAKSFGVLLPAIRNILISGDVVYNPNATIQMLSDSCPIDDIWVASTLENGPLRVVGAAIQAWEGTVDATNRNLKR